MSIKIATINAGTSSWPSWISHFTGSFVGHSPSEMLCPPALLWLLLERERKEERKREKFYIYSDGTHTHTVREKNCWYDIEMRSSRKCSGMLKVESGPSLFWWLRSSQVISVVTSTLSKTMKIRNSWCSPNSWPSAQSIKQTKRKDGMRSGWIRSNQHRPNQWTI